MIVKLTTMSRTERLAFTGKPGLMVKDMDLNRVFIMDGVTQGGVPTDSSPSLNGPLSISPNTETTYSVSGLDTWSDVSITSPDGEITPIDLTSFTFTASSAGTATISITVNGCVYPYTVDVIADSLSGAVTNLSKGPKSRTQATTAVTGNELYLMGGGSDTTISYFWKYSIDTDTWEELEEGPTRRYFSASIAHDETIYLLGGRDLASNEYVNDFWSYDPDTKTWVELTAPPRSGNGVALTSDGTYLYAINGRDDGNYHNSLHRYDPSTDAWTILTPPPTTHTYVPAGYYNGKIYKYGGYNGAYRSDIDVYDIATDTWETKTPGPVGRHAFVGGTVGSHFYVCGGWIGSLTARTDELWEYDILTDSWQEITTTMDAVQYAAGTIHDNAIYVFGGFDVNAIKVDDFYKIT